MEKLLCEPTWLAWGETVFANRGGRKGYGEEAQFGSLHVVTGIVRGRATRWALLRVSSKLAG